MTDDDRIRLLILAGKIAGMSLRATAAEWRAAADASAGLSPECRDIVLAVATLREALTPAEPPPVPPRAENWEDERHASNDVATLQREFDQRLPKPKE
jgi:hypothetical protein